MMNPKLAMFNYEELRELSGVLSASVENDEADLADSDGNHVGASEVQISLLEEIEAELLFRLGV